MWPLDGDHSTQPAASRWPMTVARACRPVGPQFHAPWPCARTPSSAAIGQETSGGMAMGERATEQGCADGERCSAQGTRARGAAPGALSVEASCTTTRPPRSGRCRTRWSMRREVVHTCGGGRGGAG